MAALILPTILLGIYMTDYLPKDAQNRMQIYGLHKSIGIIILILFFIRVINRLIKKAPALPNEIPAFDKVLSKIAHFAMYCLMLVVPLSGYLMSNSFGYPVFLFSLEMPKIAELNIEAAKVFSEIHEITAFTILGVVSVHIAAVAKHRFFDKSRVNLLKRML